MVIRASFLLFHNMQMILYHSTFFGILPSEIYLLEHYLNQPHVRQRLQTQRMSPRVYEVMVRDFLKTELCFATREQIFSLYKILFYGIEDPQFFIDPIDLDCLLHVHLEQIELNHKALSQVFLSLFNERHDSPFYSDVKTSQAGHFMCFSQPLLGETLVKVLRRPRFDPYSAPLMKGSGPLSIQSIQECR
uniref:Orf189 n=1 Tax=Batis maritima TaxID=4436 RepID=A0A068BHR3_BATMA|nr:orf189 [Batis maritima]AIC83413.1 orf189 [Batis maritima]